MRPTIRSRQKKGGGGAQAAPSPAREAGMGDGLIVSFHVEGVEAEIYVTGQVAAYIRSETRDAEATQRLIRALSAVMAMRQVLVQAALVTLGEGA